MFLRDILCIFVLSHFSPSVYKCVECTLVLKPKNVAVLSGEIATFHCASSVSKKGNIAWSTINSGNFIYINSVLDPSVSSYISVSDRDDGNCTLKINASLTAAKKYICMEADSGAETSAELIVLETNKTCKTQLTTVCVDANYSIKCAGNWDPSVNCLQWNQDPDSIVLQGIKTPGFHNDVATNTWIFNSKNELHDVYCWTKFESERPKATSATNIPEFHYVYSSNPTKKTLDECCSHCEQCSKKYCEGEIAAIVLFASALLGENAWLLHRFLKDRKEKKKEIKASDGSEKIDK